MPPFKAFIFDMNGTMINDMHYHEKAWHHILVNQLDAKMTREEVRGHMYGKNEELLERIFGKGKFTQHEMEVLGLQKETQYQKDYLPDLKLINGLDILLAKAQAHHIPMAIGTAAIPFNIDFVLDNLHIRQYFRVIVSALDVAVSKPNPEVFLKAAQQLGVEAHDCVVFEDSPKGIEAARRAGMKAVAITSYHTSEELQSDNVICIVDDYSDKVLDEVLWYIC